MFQVATVSMQGQGRFLSGNPYYRGEGVQRPTDVRSERELQLCMVWGEVRGYILGRRRTASADLCFPPVFARDLGAATRNLTG